MVVFKTSLSRKCVENLTFSYLYLNLHKISKKPQKLHFQREIFEDIVVFELVRLLHSRHRPSHRPHPQRRKYEERLETQINFLTPKRKIKQGSFELNEGNQEIYKAIFLFL